MARGTLIEATAAYQAAKVVVAVRGTGGVADELAGRYLDDRRTVKILAASGPEDAVKKVMRELTGRGGDGKTGEKKRTARGTGLTSSS